MRQYAGFGTAAESNAALPPADRRRARPGLSVAFDLPTQMGYDSDAPDRARRGRQGRGGDRLDRGHAAAVRRHPAGQGVDLDDDQRARPRCCCCSTSSSAEEQGVAGDALTGTIQNDVLKEYIARGTYIYPPKQSLRLITDIFALLPRARCRAGTRSRSPATTWPRPGRRPRRRSRSRWPNGIEYVRAAIAAGQDVDDFAPRLAFFFVSRTTLLEEVAKFRAARRIWAAGDARRVRREEPEVADAALPHPDRRRAAHRPAARGQPGPGRRSRRWPRCSAAPSRCTPTPSTRRSRCPTEKAARLALRTQQVIAYETDVTATVDPFAGSYAVESLTDEVEAAARELMDAGRGPRRRGRRDRAGLPEERDRAVGVPDRPGDRQRRAGRRRGQPVHARRRGAVRAAARRPGDRGRSRRERLARLRAERDHGDVDAAPRRAAQAAAEGTRQRALPDEGGARARGPPSARSATRCATSGASTNPRTRSDGPKPGESGRKTWRVGATGAG